MRRSDTRPYESRRDGLPVRIEVTARGVLGAWALGLLLLVCPSDAVGGVKGDREALKLIAEDHAANRNKIVTWRGSARVTDLRVQPDKTSVRYDSTVEFVYDRARKARRWRWTYDNFWRTEADGNERLVPMQVENAMIKGSSSYRASGIQRDGRTVGLMVNIADAGEIAGGPLNSDFDAMYWVNHNDDVLSNLFGMLLATTDDPQRSEWVVHRDGDIVTLSTESNDPKYGVFRDEHRVSISKGAKLLLTEITTPSGVNRCEFDYEENGDVWIPKSIKYENRQTNPRGTSHSVRLVTWNASVVNGKTTDDDFSLAALGVRSGDFMYDKRTGKEWRHQVESSSSKSSALQTAPSTWSTPFPDPPSALSRFRWIILSLLGLVVLLIFASMVWKRGRKSPTPDGERAA